MKIVVIGGTGLIGSKTIVLLRGAGHDALAAAPNTGVNTVTGEGLEAALDAADGVIDLANSASFEPAAVMGFFTAHEKNLLAAEARAGVRHHVALSAHSVDPVHGVPRSHCRCRPGGRRRQHRDRPVSADGTIEIAGPERAPFDEIIKKYPEMTDDKRPVHADPEARSFGRKGRALLSRSHGQRAARENDPR